ncbi:MAG: tetratricopeptide repeat protein [Candidatus Portnoybacteria bacterium]|nr:tetratricopeptide repeat protein [Candidatus Portnoybacteria bacterium]MDD4983057.1 tetratricopeptide repeat protein [Candidatus Portnoybacteria bacterium]
MSKENDLRAIWFCDWVIKGGLYLLAFLTPVFFLPFNLNVLELNKQLLLVVFCLVLLIAWLGKMMAEGRMELKKSWLNIGLALFAIFSLISAVVSKNLYLGLVGSGSVINEAFFSLVALLIIFFVLVNNIKSREEMINSVSILIFSGLIAGLFGAFQLAGKFLLPLDFAKIANFNSVGSVNSLEFLLASLMVLAAVLFTENETPVWRRIFYGIAAFLFLIMILSINFANVWWALLVVAIIIISLGIINRGQMSQFRLALPMLVLAFAVLMLLPIRLNLFTWLSVPSEVAPSWSASMDIDRQVLKKKPIFGVGPGEYSYAYGLYRDKVLNQTDFWSVRFNQGVSKIASQPVTLGIAGSLTWAVILIGFAAYGLFVLIKRRGRNWPLTLAIFSSWLVLALSQFFYGTNLTLEFAFWFMLGLSFLCLKTLATKGEEAEIEIEKIPAMSVSFDRTSPFASLLSFSFVVVLVLTISALYLGGSYYYADILYQKGITAVNAKNDIDGGTVKIKDAVMLNPYNDLYLRTLSRAALQKVTQEIAKPQSAERDANIQNLIATAINIGKRSTDLAPLNVDNWVQRAAIYRAVIGYINGAEQWAFDAYSEASKLEPQNPSYYYELGSTYVLGSDILTQAAQKDKEAAARQKDYLAKAEEALKKSIDAKPDYAQALFELAMVYSRTGQTNEAIASMIKTRNLYPQDIGVAFQLGLLYYKKSDWNSAKAELERAVLIDQNYSNARYFLGLVYDQLGNKPAATEQFNKVLALNPDNQDIKNILANLQAGKPAITQVPTQPSQVPIQ